MNEKINYRKASGKIYAAEVEQRQNNGGAMILQGYAAIYNSRTDLGQFDEVILSGAFNSADTSDARFLVDHGGIPLGRTSAGTMQLEADAKGLKYTVQLPETARAVELYEAIRRGDLSHSSFAFTIGAEDWKTENGRRVRYIEAINLVVDASVVTFPAYPETSVEAFALAS